jgi:hypothetical protein
MAEMRLRTGLAALVIGLSMALGGVAWATTGDTLPAEGSELDSTTRVFRVFGIDLTAPDLEAGAGYVNHGQVVSAFVHSIKQQLREAGYKGGIGCLVRVVAQSDHGKSGRAKGRNVGEGAGAGSQEFDLTLFQDSCRKGGNPERGQGNGNGNGKDKGRSR